jgi:hypothetical protein
VLSANNSTTTAAVDSLQNQTVIDAGRSGYLVVEQGPAWLAGYLYGPPEWLRVGLWLALLGLVGLTVYGAHRIDDPDQWVAIAEESSHAVLQIICVATVTYLAVNFATYPYLVDVGIGVIGGWTLATYLAPPIVRTARSVARSELEVSADE